MQPQQMISPLEGIVAVTVEIKAPAAGHENFLSDPAAVVQAFQVVRQFRYLWISSKIHRTVGGNSRRSMRCRCSAMSQLR